MKSVVEIKEVLPVIVDFIEIQKQLVSAFIQEHIQNNQSNFLINCPKSGYLNVLNYKWYFQRHGNGVCFSEHESGQVVDVHVKMVEYPDAFDAWRLSQYFESVEIERLTYKIDVIEEVDEENVIENLLKRLLEDKVIQLIPFPNLYKLL